MEQTLQQHADVADKGRNMAVLDMCGLSLGALLQGCTCPSLASLLYSFKPECRLLGSSSWEPAYAISGMHREAVPVLVTRCQAEVWREDLLRVA